MRILLLLAGSLLSFAPALLGARPLQFGLAAGPGAVSDASTRDLERGFHGQLSTTWQASEHWGVRLDALYSRWSAHENILCEGAGADRPDRCFAQTDEHDRGVASLHGLYRFRGESATPYAFAGLGLMRDWTTTLRQRQCISGTLCDQPLSTSFDQRDWAATLSWGAGVELGSHLFVELRSTTTPLEDRRSTVFPLLVGLRL